jgi:Spy/CpxP family protein refolding chaperone
MTYRITPRRFVGFAAAALLALGFGAASAQPGPRGHPQAAGGPDFGLEHALIGAKDKLGLNTLQQTQWDAAVAATTAARETGRGLMQSVKDTLQAELAKPAPDLAAVAVAADAAQQQGLVLRHKVRDQWLALYATFTPEQKAVVRDALQQKLSLFESMRQRMQQRQGGG